MTFDFQIILALISFSIGFLAGAIYLRATLKKEIRPHIYTWIIGAILAWIGVAAQFSDGERIAVISMLFTAIFCSLMTVLSIKYGTKDIKKFDTIVLIASITAIIPWTITKDPLLSVIMICIIEAMAIIPTMRKSWDDPWGEKLISWFWGAVNFTLSVFALTNFTFVTAAYPLAIVFVNASLIALCLYRRQTIAKPI